ncbi:MAG TPA: class I SAM-dependent methyltransferase [Chondromyces sp.]|nr:class I SAM-dependent methyltransferase [Chondromyces sp.]
MRRLARPAAIAVRRLARPAAIALLSAGTLTYEILLVRVFAIEQFHHFATMAIGVAMLGFGFTGTVLAVAGTLPRPRAELLFAASALLTAPALLASVVLVHRLSLDAAQLPWDASQWPRLAAVYVLLALPFAVAAAAVLLGLTLEPERPGAIYGASFAGSGLGSVLALAVLFLVSPQRALAVPALIAAPAALVAAVVVAQRNRRRLVSAGGCALLLLAAAALARPPWRLDITPYKALPQIEAYPESRRIAETSSPVGWFVAVRAAAFRHAPGLSLAYRGSFPSQDALFVDAQLAGASTRFAAAPGSEALLGWLPTAMPYALGAPERVLVLGAAGGLEAAVALVHGARRVVALELVPALEVLGWDAGDGAALGTGEVEWVIGDARAHVAASDESFDLIVAAPGRGGVGSSGAGVYALDADFMHTVGAYVEYLERLGPGGTLAVTRWMTLPARPGPRLVLTAGSALRKVAPDALDRGLVVMHGWATSTVLVRPDGFSKSDLAALRAWCRQRRFDLDWPPVDGRFETQINILDEPVLERAAEAVTAGGDRLARFADDYPFNIEPATDGRPYPHHYLRLGSLPAFFGADRGDWLPFAEWGHIALVATLVQSFVLAVFLLAVPAALVRRSGPLIGRARLVSYFGLIGLAFLAAEIAAIQQLTLLLGHPVYSVAVVLAAFLVASGTGSALSDRRAAGDAWRVAALIAALLVVLAAGSLALVHAVHAAPLAVRGLAALLLMLPLAFLMGFPFPLGLRRLVRPQAVGGTAWAWAANGFASVMAAPLAGLLALEAGTSSVFLFAAGCYAAAALLARGASTTL